jgi:predicted double-glycine peptidase
MKIKHLLFAQNDVVIQQAGYTCGPCTLLNVLRLKGDPSHTEDELSKSCNAKPETGTSQKDLMRVAKEIGIEVVEEKKGADISDIERNIDNGNYVIVCYMHAFAGEGHYAVITEYDDVALYFVDPSFGIFRLRKEYLKKWWYGSSGVQQWYAAVR